MVKKLQCVVVDDEPLAREILTKYIEVVDFLELKQSCENALELSQVLEQSEVDLIFLDIQMPHMSGVDFLKISKNLPMVILTTAFSNYALEGFQFDVMDYLLKPITFNRFFKAATKAQKFHQLKHQPAAFQTEEKEPAYFFIKCESKYEKILMHEILFIKALQNYVMIYTEKENYMTLLPLKTVQESLDSEAFIKVHKSYLVAMDKIETIEQHELKIGEHQIPISRNYREVVKGKVLKGKVLKKGVV